MSFDFTGIADKIEMRNHMHDEVTQLFKNMFTIYWRPCKYGNAEYDRKRKEDLAELENVLRRRFFPTSAVTEYVKDIVKDPEVLELVLSYNRFAFDGHMDIDFGFPFKFPDSYLILLAYGVRNAERMLPNLEICLDACAGVFFKADPTKMCTKAMNMLVYVDCCREALKDSGCSESLAQEIIDMLCNENNIIDCYNITKDLK